MKNNEKHGKRLIPRKKAITEAILKRGKETGNYFQAFWDHYGRPKTTETTANTTPDMIQEQWKSILETINEVDSTYYDVPDDETEFWEEHDKVDNAINDLKNLVEQKIEEAEEENPN